MDKSPDAFRTIREVSEWLNTPAHVLRFWESKFSQVRPVKRAGGRRYYRPNDMLLLGGIKKLLHEDGLTIKGVQRLLGTEGTKAVAALSQPLEPYSHGDVYDGTAEKLEHHGSAGSQERLHREAHFDDDEESLRAPASEAEKASSDGHAVDEQETTSRPEDDTKEDEPQQVIAFAHASRSSTKDANAPESASDRENLYGANEGTASPSFRLSPTSPAPVTSLLMTTPDDALREKRDEIAPLYQRLKSLRDRLDRDRPDGGKD